MALVLNAPLMAFLGIQYRYWAIILVVVAVILVVAYFARRRSIS